VRRLLRLALTLTTLSGGLHLVGGCSGQSVQRAEDVKVNNMTPGEYRDAAEDPPPRTKGAKGGARSKSR